MHIMQEFIVKRVVPQFLNLERAQASENLATKRAANADIFESFLWLHLGTEIGVFEQHSASLVYERFYSGFFETLNAKRPEVPEQLFRSELYVYDTPESRELKASFPDFVILIEKAMRRDSVFDTQLNQFSNSNILRPLFKSLLLISTRIVDDALVRHLVTALQFVDQSSWERLWNSGQCDPEDVLQVGQEEEDADRLDAPPAARLYAGFLKLWKYTFQLRQHFDVWELDPEIGSDDRFKLTSRIRAMQQWRLNLTSLQAAQRYEQIVRAIKRSLDAEGGANVDLQRVVSDIKESFDEVMSFYLSVATARAG